MSSSGDGCDAVTTADEESFSAWLAEHGALYPKIEWPTRQTVGGVRGTTARADIASGEREMLQIPLKLMMAPPTTEKSEAFGELMRAYDIVPRGSMLSLTVFLLLEKILKGEASFWHPYIRMLPHPGTTLDWSAAELVELQDETVHSESQRLRAQHAVKFHACFERLRERFPAIVGATKSESAALGFTAPAWEWCAMNVQARCFGRRLPWLALVPFADSLNHANVATKYDFDVEDNGCFRLFPVGSNSYAQGAEVFNSYGRRDNRHLLVHYGFAMEGNEHDKMTVRVTLDECARGAPGVAAAEAAAKEEEDDGLGAWSSATMVSKRAERCRLLSRRGVCHHGRVTLLLRLGHFAVDLLDVCRVAVMDDAAVVDAVAPKTDEPKSRGRAPSDGLPESLELERAAIAATRAVYTRELGAFPTTLAEDEALLGEGAREAESESAGLPPASAPPPRLRFALHYRMMRKQLIAQQLATLARLDDLVVARISLRPPSECTPMLDAIYYGAPPPAAAAAAMGRSTTAATVHGGWRGPVAEAWCARITSLEPIVPKV